MPQGHSSVLFESGLEMTAGGGQVTCDSGSGCYLSSQKMH